MMHRRRYFPRHRPPWWPENEPWNPRGYLHRNPFFRRLGCLFGIINLLGIFIFLAVLGLIGNIFRVEYFPLDLSKWIFPLGVGLILLLLGFVYWGVFGLRRMSIPLDDLLEVAGLVAQGDYSARVEEKGPAEVRSLTKAFNSMAAQLQLVNEQRRDLLADVTHELRTPLTIIQGNLEGMLDGVYPADEYRLKSILEETQLLSRLVEDLRTLVLAESGTLQLKKEPTDLAALLREVVTGFGSQAEAKGVKLEVALTELSLINIDPARMREIVMNLIANAIRYAPSNGVIQIRLDVNELEPEKQAVVSVTDNGPGIPSDDLSKVFTRFYKAGDSGGMGLGLSIAKYLVEAHGGVIKAESHPGKGTEISFSVPIDRLS
jgi:signal transduction histidine kinase